MKFGLIAGNGQFPFLVIEGARRSGASLSVVAIKEETDPRINDVIENVLWVGIGQLGKMISFFKREAPLREPMLNVLGFSSRKIVNDCHTVAVIHQSVHQMAAVRQHEVAARRHGRS